MFGRRKERLDCCGGEGRHLDGCTQSVRRNDRKNAKHDERVANLQVQIVRQRREAKRNLIGRRFGTRPMDAAVAQDCHVERDRNGWYWVVENRDRGRYGRTA